AMAVDHCKSDVVKQLYQKEAQFRLGLVLTCKASAYAVKLQEGADVMVTPKPEFVCFVYDHWTKIFEARVVDVKSPPLKELGDSGHLSMTLMRIWTMKKTPSPKR
ncbi:unnamed protein product, partial [Owenia fusiformis]